MFLSGDSQADSAPSTRVTTSIAGIKGAVRRLRFENTCSFRDRILQSLIELSIILRGRERKDGQERFHRAGPIPFIMRKGCAGRRELLVGPHAAHTRSNVPTQILA